MINGSRNSRWFFDRPRNGWEKLPSVFCMTRYVSQTVQTVKFCFIPALPSITQSFAQVQLSLPLCAVQDRSSAKIMQETCHMSHILYSPYLLSMLGRHKSKPSKCSCLDPLGTALIVDTTWTRWTVSQSAIKENVTYSATTILFHLLSCLHQEVSNVKICNRPFFSI